MIGDATYPIPTGLGSLVGTRLLTIREKWRLARLMMTLGKLDARPFDGVSLRAWLDQTAGPGNLAIFLGALFRLSTYGDDPEQMSAGAALDQLKLALAGNVWYLDGGWQTLVDGLRDRAASYRSGISDACQGRRRDERRARRDRAARRRSGTIRAGRPFWPLSRRKRWRSSLLAGRIAVGTMDGTRRTGSGGLPRPGPDASAAARESLRAWGSIVRSIFPSIPPPPVWPPKAWRSCTR